MTEERNPLDEAVEQLLDLFVYAPIGLLYEKDEVLPKLVTRGRSQVQIARVLSQLAVRRGQGQVEQRLVDALAAPAEELAKLLTELGVRFGLAPPADGQGQASVTDPDAAPAPPTPVPADPTAPGAEASPPQPPAPAPPADRPSAAGSSAEAPPAPVATDRTDDPAAPRVPIAGYDQLRARDILPLLIDLSPAQRRAVREHELAGRGRKTILSQIDRLGV